MRSFAAVRLHVRAEAELAIFFFNDTATTEIYTLSLHDALPISVSPRADVSTVEARRSAYRLLLERGLIRVGLSVPADAEFSVDAIDDPYGYATARELSIFRRPLPTTHLRFGASIMWDGRELALDAQADGAARDHALSARDRKSVV